MANIYLDAYQKLISDPTTPGTLERLDRIIDSWAQTSDFSVKDAATELDGESSGLAKYAASSIRFFSYDSVQHESHLETCESFATGVPGMLATVFVDERFRTNVDMRKLGEALIELAVRTNDVSLRTYSALEYAVGEDILDKEAFARLSQVPITRPYQGSVYIGDENSFRLCMPKLGKGGASAFSSVAKRLVDLSERLELVHCGDVVGYVSSINTASGEHAGYSFEWHGIRMDFSPDSREFASLLTWSSRKVAEAIKADVRYAITPV